MVPHYRVVALASLLLLQTSLRVLAHDHAVDGHGAEMVDATPVISMPNATTPVNMPGTSNSSLTYFALSQHASLMLGHIILMTVGWFFVLPIGENLCFERGVPRAK